TAPAANVAFGTRDPAEFVPNSWLSWKTGQSRQVLGRKSSESHNLAVLGELPARSRAPRRRPRLPGLRRPRLLLLPRNRRRPARRGRRQRRRNDSWKGRWSGLWHVGSGLRFFAAGRRVRRPEMTTAARAYPELIRCP